MKYLYLVASLFASLAFGQSVVQTGKIAFISNGSAVNATVVNSPYSLYYVAAGAGADAYSNPCAFGGNSSNTAHFYVNDAYGYPGNTLNPQYLYLNSALGSWSYPNNVSITKLTYRFCYLLNGYLDHTTTLTPVFRNKVTGNVFTAPAAALTASSSPWNGFTVSETVPYASAAYVWTLATPISSIDWNNTEIGFVYQGRSPTIIKIFNMDVRATFTSTVPQQTTLINPTISYSPSSPWNSGTVTVDVRPGSPSDVIGTQVMIRCGDGTYQLLQNWYWGAVQNPFGHIVHTYSISQINSAYCIGRTLSVGQTTSVRVQPLNSSTPYGSYSYSNSVTLN